MKYGLLSLKYKNDDKFSLHKVIKCSAINLLQYLTEHLEGKQIKKAAIKKDNEGRTAMEIAEYCENKLIKKELENAIKGIELVMESDSDTQLEEEIIQSINEDVLIKDDDYDDMQSSMKTPIPRETEKEYLLKIKEDFDAQYKHEMGEKEETIRQLKDMVINQDKAIQKMKRDLLDLQSQTKSQHKSPNVTPEVPKAKPKEEPKPLKKEERKSQVKSSKRSRKDTQEMTK